MKDWLYQTFLESEREKKQRLKEEAEKAREIKAQEVLDQAKETLAQAKNDNPKLQELEQLARQYNALNLTKVLGTSHMERDVMDYPQHMSALSNMAKQFDALAKQCDENDVEKIFAVLTLEHKNDIEVAYKTLPFVNKVKELVPYSHWDKPYESNDWWDNLSKKDPDGLNNIALQVYDAISSIENMSKAYEQSGQYAQRDEVRKIIHHLKLHVQDMLIEKGEKLAKESSLKGKGQMKHAAKKV